MALDTLFYTPFTSGTIPLMAITGRDSSSLFSVPTPLSPTLSEEARLQSYVTEATGDEPLSLTRKKTVTISLKPHSSRESETKVIADTAVVSSEKFKALKDRVHDAEQLIAILYEQITGVVKTNEILSARCNSQEMQYHALLNAYHQMNTEMTMLKTKHSNLDAFFTKKFAELNTRLHSQSSRHCSELSKLTLEYTKLHSEIQKINSVFSRISGDKPALKEV